jgi:hypothetical protein
MRRFFCQWMAFVNGSQLIMQRDPHNAPVQPTALTGRQLLAVFWPFLRPYRRQIVALPISLIKGLASKTRRCLTGL